MEGVEHMTVYFKFRETVDRSPDRVIIVPNYDRSSFTVENGGSFAVAPARVLGLSYPEYLRFLRESFPEQVSIEGKGSYYPIAYWRKGKELYTFIDLLNAKMRLAVMTAKDQKKEVEENHTH